MIIFPEGWQVGNMMLHAHSRYGPKLELELVLWASPNGNGGMISHT